MLENPYSKPVKTSGMSIVLFKIDAYFKNRLFAISTLDPRCKNPAIRKNIRETFLMFCMVFVIAR